MRRRWPLKRRSENGQPKRKKTDASGDTDTITIVASRRPSAIERATDTDTDTETAGTRTSAGIAMTRGTGADTTGRATTRTKTIIGTNVLAIRETKERRKGGTGGDIDQGIIRGTDEGMGEEGGAQWISRT